MPLGQTYCGKDHYSRKSKMRCSSPRCKSHEMKEEVSKVKTYNQVRNEVMDNGDQQVENMSQVVSKLKKPAPKKK